MDASLQPSSAALVYLFSGQIIPAPKGFLPQSALDPIEGKKLDLKQLVIKTYTAALMDQVESGCITLDLVPLKKFLGKENAIVPTVTAVPDNPPASFAARLHILLNGARRPEERRVREVVISVVGGRDSTEYPWFHALAPIINEAVRLGWVTQGDKPGFFKTLFNPTEAVTRVFPVQERIQALAGAGSEALARLAAFESNLGDRAALLRKEIETGVEACKTVPDSD